MAEAMEKAQHVIGESPQPHVPIIIGILHTSFPLEAPIGFSRKPDEVGTSLLAQLRGQEKGPPPQRVGHQWGPESILRYMFDKNVTDRSCPVAYGASPEARLWGTSHMLERKPGSEGPHTELPKTISILSWRIHTMVGVAMRRAKKFLVEPFQSRRRRLVQALGRPGTRRALAGQDPGKNVHDARGLQEEGRRANSGDRVSKESAPTSLGPRKVPKRH